MSLPIARFLLAFLALLPSGAVLPAQEDTPSPGYPRSLFAIPAVSGYEQELAAEIRARLKDFSPKTDNLGDLYVTLGSGSPHRLIVTPMDEPGYVVSQITPDGFLRVQRLPQRTPTAIFDLLHSAQPVWIMTRGGKKISGVFTGLSVHLQPARQNPPAMAHPDEMYVDIGARNAVEVRAAGVDVLDPVSLVHAPIAMGAGDVSSPSIGDRSGCEALIELLQMMGSHKSEISGTLTVAFVAQHWTGGRGLDRVLNEFPSQEMIYVGRLSTPPEETSKSAPAAAHSQLSLGGGVLLGLSDLSAAPVGLPADLKKLAEQYKIALTPVLASAPAISGYVKPTALPERFAQVGITTLFPVTPAETINLADMHALEHLLYRYLLKSEPLDQSSAQASGAASVARPSIELLTESYGVSGHEQLVREQVKKLLPAWAKPEQDDAGNLILHIGNAKPDAKTPKLVFVAHLDEIGYQVRSIEPDGRLLVDVLGGGYTEYFLGHAVLLHTAQGKTLGGLLEPPSGWDQPGFQWPHGPNAMDDPAHLYVGTRSAEETQKLGIEVGDWATVPKKYRPLLGRRANARSFDDRVGCAALLEAVNALGPNLRDRDVTFIWSTEEEVGLKGAAAAAERMAKDGHAADFVFAIDTFVSSDSPIESKRFADAQIGDGFVLRAVDNSNITPREYLERVVKLANENKIPVQYGVTGGGNDGAVFVRYGAVDIPLGWPLRYSHSPGEVIDLRDLDALGKIIAVLARKW